MSNALTAKQSAMALPVIADDLNGYLSKISNITLLSAEEEQTLARDLRENENLDAARSLVMSQLRFVVHIARTYKGYGLPLADLVQEGNIGLMKAVKRFDPDKNVRLISFAVHWIRAEIHEYVIRNWRIVKVATTKSQRKLFFKLRSAKKQLNWLSHDEVQAVAKDLGVEPEVVMEMESRMHGHPAGAIPKDGPSAGVAMYTGLVSLYTGKRVNKDIGMTGEINLRGQVLPIGGLKEKSLGAENAGIRTILIPEGNKKDVRDIPESAMKKLKVQMLAA